MKITQRFLKAIVPINLFSAHVLAGIVFFSLTGCREIPQEQYALRGRVVSVNPAREEVTLEHEEIPGYMDAMTMPFRIKDAWAIPVLEPGQHLEAILVVRQNRSWIEDIRITGTSSAEDIPETAVLPEPGDVVPDFSLLNQNGRKIHLYDYGGRPLLVTFIYTRCPLPDYCPLMSGNFAAIHQRFQFMPDSDRIPHLLSVSFDTEHDSPAVLREYAARYMRPVRFDRWEFATGSPEEIKAITAYFGIVYREESGQFDHSLMTALIGPDGKLARLYPGNRWRPDEILKDLGLNEGVR